MNKKYYINLITIFIVSLGLNIISILLAPFSSPDDLGQLAFIIYIFFPISAVITGVLSQRLRLALWAAPVISAMTVSIAILVRYNSAGLKFTPVYAAIALAGHLLFWGIEVIIKKYKP